MARVAHDLLVGHAVAVGGRHETGAQPVRADRLLPGASNPGITGSPEQDVADRAHREPGLLDRTTAVHLAEDRAVGGRCFGQPTSA